MDSYTDDARRSMEILSELSAKMRESEARCSAQADDAEAASRNLRNAAKAYHEHGNALQGAINALAGLLDQDRPKTAEMPATGEFVSARVDYEKAKAASNLRTNRYS